MSTEFSRTLSLLRKERGVSQRMAAADLGVSQALLSHYENGIREPGLAFVVKACDYYHVSADYMLGRTLARDGSMLTPEEVLDMAEPGPMYYRAACWLRCGASSLPAPAACCSACWESWATRPPSMRRQTVWAVRSICCTGCFTGPQAAARILCFAGGGLRLRYCLCWGVSGAGGLCAGHSESGAGKGQLPGSVP